VRSSTLLLKLEVERNSRASQYRRIASDDLSWIAVLPIFTYGYHGMALNASSVPNFRVVRPSQVIIIDTCTGKCNPNCNNVLNYCFHDQLKRAKIENHVRVEVAA
jgi:hypothetical protein